MDELIEERGLLWQNDYIMVPGNVKVVAGSRNDFLLQLPKKLSCIEIGVAQGGFSRHILHIIEPIMLFLVDQWACEDAFDQEKATNDETVCREYFEGIENVKIFHEKSIEAIKHFGDAVFDLIYIDAAHEEDAVYSDLMAWWPKLKSGGFLMGHDFCTTGHWSYEVVPAVYRFLKDESMAELYGMTAYVGNEFPSFILRKSMGMDINLS